MGKITWGIGKTRIELDAHRCQPFLRKSSVQRALNGKVQKGLNQIDMFKTFLNVAKSII